ncbi:MAG: lipoyl(octanoyl) transferase LipB [Anaerolineae bacterium]|nr:MAG: lipoyl(octanoyl) transferase LipB [Anaerolineae bacterium]
MQCDLYRLGVIEYQKAFNLQNQLAAQIASGERGPALLLLEHDPVYTFGRQGKPENMLWDEAECARRGITLHETDRGGDVTYHGPGQLVGYPILPLAHGDLTTDPDTGQPRLPQADYVGYLRKLEMTLIISLSRFGIGGGQIKGQTGVWVQPDVLSRCRHCPPELKQSPAKIASIGVRVDARGVSRHGFSLNVSPDMSHWDGILACGLENQNKVSLEMLVDPPPSVDEVAAVVGRAFGEVFGYEMVAHEGVLLI